jgi:molybdenum cofactor cytidylyltransferase
MILGVVLAAGLSRRMGQPKLLLTLEGKPVLRHAVERMLADGVDEAVIVVPPEHGDLEAALAGIPVRLAVNPKPEAGQGSSIAVGVSAAPAGAEAVLIALGDQPRLPPQVIPGLIAAFRRMGKAITAPRYREGQGNPVLFGPQVIPELRALTGDRGARAVIEKDTSRVAWVDFDEPMPADVDTPEDYDRVRSRDRGGVN